MALTKAANATSPKCLLNPKDWDFRFVKPSELEVMAVYEYARSCPWVWSYWEPWLKEKLSVSTSTGNSKGESKTVRAIIRKYLNADVPVWEAPGADAKSVISRIPAVITRSSLKYLVCCVPSFPARWDDLPDIEKTAALSLVPGSLPVFRTAAKPAWSTKLKATIAIEIDADFKKIRKVAEHWLACQREAYEAECRRLRKSMRAEEKRRKLNPGRSAVKRREALSWLGAWRLHQAGFEDFDDAVDVMDEWLDITPKPTEKHYPVPYTPEMDDYLWNRWNTKAEGVMVAMFFQRNSMPPNCLLPKLRWTPQDPR